SSCHGNRRGNKNERPVVPLVLSLTFANGISSITFTPALAGSPVVSGSRQSRASPSRPSSKVTRTKLIARRPPPLHASSSVHCQNGRKLQRSPVPPEPRYLTPNEFVRETQGQRPSGDSASSSWNRTCSQEVRKMSAC